jgi:hypothetical protein
MTGTLKVLHSHKTFFLKEKRTYNNVDIHFRDLHSHTLKLSNGKVAVIYIQAITIEAESMLIEADGYNEGKEPAPAGYEDVPSILLELRFYPDGITDRQANQRKNKATQKKKR